MFARVAIPLPAGISRKPYDASATPEEVAALKACCGRLEEGVYFWKEIPVPTLFTTELFFERLDEVARGVEPYGLVVDVSDTGWPSGELIAHLRLRVRERLALHRHIAFMIERNLLVRSAVRLVIPRSPLFSVHRTLSDALEAARGES